MSALSPTLPRNQILVGDALDRLAALPDAAVDCVITSPPYFGLRDYGHDGQIGAEPRVDDWVKRLLDVCREVRRVLKPQGGLWLNLGDGYSRHPSEGAPKKSLLMAPQRLALALVAEGWILRNQVIWAKTNPMPASVTDRLTCTYEVVYFFSRQARYFFDLDAIREQPKYGYTSHRRRASSHYPPRSAAPLKGNHPRIDLNEGIAGLREQGRTCHPLGKNPSDVWQLGTASYRGAHFATFPMELIRRPLLATCPEKVCAGCGRPWRHQLQRRAGRLLAVGPLAPGCTCGQSPVPGVVLDPFMGSGTVALAAERYRRDWLGIELNRAYAVLAEGRLRKWRSSQQSGTEAA